MKTSIRIPALFLFQLLWVSASAFAQGPLQPPGPPAPTMKTLQQIDARLALQWLSVHPLFVPMPADVEPGPLARDPTPGSPGFGPGAFA